MADDTDQKNTPSIVSLAWDLGWIFAVPLVVFAIVGRVLDKRFDVSPLFLLVGIIGAAITSSVGVFFKVRAIMRTVHDVPHDEDTQK